MNLPNALTLLRIFFVPLLVVVLLQAGNDHSLHLLALGIFVAAALTDLLDGYLARRWGQITTVGMLLDPIADKLLVSSALIALVQLQRIPGWLAVLLIGREFAVSGLRGIAATEGYTIKASELGKTKMAGQVLGIALVLLTPVYPELATPARWTLWAVLLFSLVSAADYFLKFWKQVDERIKARRRSELLQLERQRATERATSMRERFERD